MSTYRLGMPSELKRGLRGVLPRLSGATLFVLVKPRDHAERLCPVYDADHYEIQAYYTRNEYEALDGLEKALAAVPGVYLTTQVLRAEGGNAVTNPAWPAALGARRRGFGDLRGQVMALIRD